jgi:Tfp pilus assembly protein PilF
VALRQKDEPKAQEELAKAAALDPSYGSIHLALADLLARRQDGVAEALEHYRAFLRIGGNPRDESRVKRLLPSLKKTLASR